MNVRRWLAATCCVPLLALAACSEDEPSAEPDEPSRTSSSPDPNQSDAAPPLPPEASKRTAAGAETFAKHWISVFNHASATGDTTSLAALSGAGCETCSNYVALIKKIYGPGGRIESDGWEVTEARGSTSPGGTSVAMRVTQSPERVIYVKPKRTKEFDGGQAKLVARLGWSDEGWRMDRLDLA